MFATRGRCRPRLQIFRGIVLCVCLGPGLNMIPLADAARARTPNGLSESLEGLVLLKA